MRLYFLFLPALMPSYVENVISCLSNIKKYIVICLLGKSPWGRLLSEFKLFKGVFNHLMYETHVCIQN